ncbi:kinase-like protein [Rhizophagus clarus]|uniref:Kinase-like protein n=1 Tax=Rhizophagus clarus TaxID=94130 RepID=A0A8H3LJ14_9GLOM|nr:kinase-like protein [Rhizophagus clarus]
MGAGCCKEEEIDFDAEVELSHFHLLRSVGKGAFGKVRVVQHKHTKILYALKYINKAKCIKMRAVENIVQERRLLEEIEYNLVCNLRYAFQDDENLFMVLDLMLGGDLRFHLERQGSMKEEVVKFYVAEVSLGLHYLHSKKIVHRDLKPDNVLLDEKGHAHLTDFNIAVHFNERKPLTSVAGSMAYMAPEILLKKGYFDTVDWWSLGVVMYELLFSKRPFRGKTNPQLTQAILKDPLVFPDNVSVSEECLDCMRKFCERDISKRLGCGPNGLEDIKRHPWFEGIEWDKLETKMATPPFIPDSKRANFDATHELEELLLEDNPLKAKKRANPNQDLSELSREMRMMEEKFLVYDFTKMRRRSYYNNNNAKIVTHGRQGSDLSAIGCIDEHKEKNREWLNERPASPPHRENRRTSGFGFGAMPSNERINPIGASHELDHNSMKSYPVGRVSPSSSITIDRTDNHKQSHSAYSTQANTSSLLPPPRVQSPVQKIQTTPSSSRPSSPNPQPSLSCRSSPRLIAQKSNPNSLNNSPTDPLPSQGLISPPQLPPPNVPLPPPPNTFSTSSSSTLVNSSLSINAYNQSASSSRVRSMSPPSTNKRPTILTESLPTGNELIRGNSSETVSTSISSVSSENPNGSVGSDLSPSRHYRNPSNVSTGSGALSAVGVPIDL